MKLAEDVLKATASEVWVNIKVKFIRDKLTKVTAMLERSHEVDPIIMNNLSVTHDIIMMSCIYNIM